MDKNAYNLLTKKIEEVDTALKIDILSERQRNKLLARKQGLILERNNIISQQYGVIV